MIAPRQLPAEAGSAIVAVAGGWAESRWLFPSLLTAVVAGLFSDALGPDSLFAYRDSAHFYPPLYRLVREEWLAGRVPLWNHLVNCGQPLAGSATSGAFYLPQLLVTLVLPDGLSLNVLVIGHLALAATGGYLLARQQGLSRAAASLGGLAYGFAGSVLFQIYNPIYAAGAAWLVWAVLGGWNLLHGGGLRDFLLVAVALAMSVLAGDPQDAYHAGLVLGGVWLVTARAEPGRPWWKQAGLLGLTAVAAGLLALVQIALAAEATAESTRSADVAPHSLWDVPRFLRRQGGDPEIHWYDILVGRPPRMATHYYSMYAFSVTPWRIVELFWPGFSGALTHRWTIVAGLDSGMIWATSLYAGVVTAILAWLAAAGGDHRRRVWLIVGSVAVLASLGGYGGIGLVRNGWNLLGGRWAELGYRPGDEVGGVAWLMATCLPGYAGFRYPGKWMTVAALALGQLAACGLDGLGDPATRGRFRTWGGRLALLLAGFAVIAAAVHMTGRSQIGWLVAAGGGQAALVVLLARNFAGRLWERRAAAAVTLLVALAACDLVLAGRGLVLVGRFSDLVAGGGYLDSLAARRRSDLTAVSSRIRLVARSSDQALVPPGDGPAFMESLGAVQECHMPWLHGCEKILEPGTVTSRDLILLGSSMVVDGRALEPRRTFDLCGAEFFVLPAQPGVIARTTALQRDWSREQRAGRFTGIEPVGEPLPAVEVPLVGHESAGPIVIVTRNESALPRARIVRDVAVVQPVRADRPQERDDFLKRIAFPNPDLPDLVTAAVVESETPLPPAVASVGSATLPASDRCRIVVDEPQRVVVEADLVEPGLVVLADAFHPDWSLHVRSAAGPPQPQAVLRTNRLHRGCWLPAGRHLLEYRYRSPTFARTAWISGLAWVAVAVAFMATRRSPARRQPPARPASG